MRPKTHTTKPNPAAKQLRIQGHVERSANVLRQIADLGRDPKQLQNVDCFFYTNDEDDAIALASCLKANGFRDIQMSNADNDSDYPWSVVAVLTSSPISFAVPDMFAKLVSIAEDYNATFDGWGTQLG